MFKSNHRFRIVVSHWYSARCGGVGLVVVFVCGDLDGVYNAVMKKGLGIKIIICLAVTFSAPVIASLVANPGTSDWYANLNKPFLNPPGWVFGPVWTVLYILMAVSAALVWQKGLAERKVRLSMGLYLAQLILNAL